MEYEKLGDYCDITSSKRVFANQYVSDGIPFYRSREIIEKKESKDISEPLFISKELYDTFKRKFGVPQKGDLLLTSVGTLGIPYIVKDEVFYFKDGNLTWMKNFKDGLDSRYLYYWLNSKFGKESLIVRAIGSSQAALTIDILKKYKLFIPSIKTQNKIVDILSAYDDLIENNNHRIALLEKAAQDLYKEWFVRFRFPGHQMINLVESRLGKIPSNFNLIKMNDAFDYYIGGGWGNDEYSSAFPERAYVIRGTDFPSVQKGDLSGCPLRYHKKSNYSARELRENDIIIEVSGGTAEQPVGRTLLVTKDVIDRLGGKVICASFCKQIRLNTEVVAPYYFYYWMRFLYDTRIIDRFQLQSTGIINFKFEYFLRKGDIMLPPKDLMDRFDKKVKVLYNEISLLAQQNENLAKQRDLLLPRLMSGKLEV